MTPLKITVFAAAHTAGICSKTFGLVTNKIAAAGAATLARPGSLVSSAKPSAMSSIRSY